MPPRSFVARHFALELDGSPCGFLRSAEGGGVKADVVAQQVGGMALRSKHIGLPQPEAFSVSVGMSMSKTFWTWLEDSWNGNITRRDGAVQTCDRDLNIVHEQTFLQALVTETGFPACDGSSKEPGYITVKFMPELTRHKATGSGKPKGIFSQQQKLWSPANFRLQLEGLDCSRVNKIEAFTIKQNTKRLEIGPKREYELEPTSLEFPNLTVTTSMATAKTWFDWHDDFLIKGNNSADKEKSGSLTFLSPKGEELLMIELKGLGISNLSVDKGDSGTDSIKRVKCELYVEEMNLKYIGGIK
jgi:hypothetical protein